MTLSEFSIRRPVFAWMLMAGLIVFGTLTAFRLGISQMPDVDFPMVSISVSLPGAAPNVLESQVVDVIEDAVMGIEGIRNVSSSSRQQSASVNVEFELEKNIDIAVQEVQARINQVQTQLPIDLDPPVIRKTNMEDQPIMWIVLTSDGAFTAQEQMAFARDVLFDNFTTVKGVGDVFLGGYVDPNLRVWLSYDKLAKYELTVADVIGSIRSNHQEVPAGRLENDQKEFNVRILGEANSVPEFGRIPIPVRGGRSNFRPIPLKDISTIEYSLADVRRISRFNGQQAVGIGVVKQHGSNSLEVADSIRAKLKELQVLIPKGLSLAERVDNTGFIRDSAHELLFVLLMSALLTSLVCFLFLGSWSTTVNVLMAIPTSIIGAFIVIYFFKFTLNTFTLLALSLAIGIVVDDAIMMLENIMRNFDLGMHRKQAAIKGAREITFAAVAATIAVVAIFLPVIFMKGIIGSYLYQYGITVTAAVLLSLLEALTLTPMRASRFLEKNETPYRVHRWMNWLLDHLTKSYEKILRRCLRNRWKVVFGSILFFGLSISVVKKIPGELVPPQDQSRFLLRMKTPVGSSLVFTNDNCKKVEDYLKTRKEVIGFYAAVGGFGGDAVNEAMLFVTLAPPNERKQRQAEIMESVKTDLKKILKKTQIFAQDMSLRGFSSGRGFPVEFSVQGPDWDKLGQLTLDLIEKIKISQIVTDLNTDYQLNANEVDLMPDRERAARYGVSMQVISQTVNSLVGGQIMGSQTRYYKNGHRYDIRVRLVGKEREEPMDLHKIFVRNNRGELVMLSELTKIVEKPALQVISRRNRERAISVNGNIAAGHAQEEAIKIVEKAAHDFLPNGYHIELTGNAQTFKESNRSLMFAFLLGIIVSYMVLASQFNSFIHPVTVLVALPFSISGAFLGLFIFHQSINIFSMIGLILLMGIVKKNSILLVDFTNQLRFGNNETGAEGESGAGLDNKIQDEIQKEIQKVARKTPNEALLEACPVRLRPILMTSIATICGALPEALSIGPGAETLIPMAIAIIGGVIVSTFLTLFVVPCVYSLLTFFERKSETLIQDSSMLMVPAVNKPMQSESTPTL